MQYKIIVNHYSDFFPFIASDVPHARVKAPRRLTVSIYGLRGSSNPSLALLVMTCSVSRVIIVIKRILPCFETVVEKRKCAELLFMFRAHTRPAVWCIALFRRVSLRE